MVPLHLPGVADGLVSSVVVELESMAYSLAIAAAKVFDALNFVLDHCFVNRAIVGA